MGSDPDHSLLEIGKRFIEGVGHNPYGRQRVLLRPTGKDLGDMNRVTRGLKEAITLSWFCVTSACTASPGGGFAIKDPQKSQNFGYRIFQGCSDEVGESQKKRAFSAMITALKQSEWEIEYLEKETYSITGRYCYRGQSAYCTELRFISKKDGSMLGQVLGMTDSKLKKRMDAILNDLNRAFRNQICQTDEALNTELKNYGMSLP